MSNEKLTKVQLLTELKNLEFQYDKVKNSNIRIHDHNKKLIKEINILKKINDYLINQLTEDKDYLPY